MSHLDEYDLVVGARSARTQAGVARRAGNAVLNALASYLTEQPIPDLTSGFRAARRECLAEFLHLLPNGFSTPTTTTLAFMKAGYSVRFEPIEARARQGASKIRLASDGVGFFLILIKVITIFSPLRDLSAGQRGRVRRRRRLRGVDDRDAVARHQLVGAADSAERRDSAGGPRVGADFVAALRGAALMTTTDAAARPASIVPTYNERANLPVLVAGADGARPTCACWSSTTSRRTAPASSPTSSRASIPGGSR